MNTAVESDMSLMNETANGHNPHNSSIWYSQISRQLGYKHAICQNVVPSKKLFVLTYS